MSILDIKNISFSYGFAPIFKDASMRLFFDEHAVLVGPNGHGKSTLMKFLARELKPDLGSVTWQPHVKVGYLDQFLELPEDVYVKDYIHDVFKDLFDLEEKMEVYYERASSGLDEDAKYFDYAHDISEILLAKGFYQLKSTIDNVIYGLGLSAYVLKQPLNQLSGGMKAKMMLAKLLLQDSDCLLLDEPTNFLDVKHIDFLAQYLNNYPKAFIVISHDEAFIKKIARTIYAIESKKIERYKGDLDYYMRERQLRFDIKEKAFETQKQKIDKEQTFIQKNIARASTTKRAQSRRKMLDKIVKVDAPNKSKTYTFNFPFSGRSGDIVLNVDNLSIGYEAPLLDSIDLELRRQMKLAITGKNGIGKSTFLKTLLSEIDPIDGSFTWSDTAEIIYFSQTLHIDEKMTAYQYIRLFYTYEDEQFIYQLLASYGITYEMANRGLLTLSGGEQTKVRLAVLKKQKSNVLILDEPTNHLDASAKQALVDAMQTYQGTLVLVSHETDIYQDVCDELMELY